MNESIFNALLLADSRLPTGNYAYSAGLEPAVMAGLGVADIPAYMQARLQTVTRLECSGAVQAHRLAVAQSAPAAYERLEAAISARTPSQALRSTSRSLGRALLRLALSLRPNDPGVRALSGLEQAPTRGIALGVFGAALAISERRCAEICCYDDLQCVAEATLKLLPTTPATVTQWVVAAGEYVGAIVEQACSLRSASELPALSAPWMEQCAEAHSHQTRRLFLA